MDKPLVLIVEDDPTQQRVLEMLADKAGIDAHLVSTGKAALEAFDRNYYQLILMDWRMNDMDGLECARRIRLIEQPRFGVRTPIIAVTANAMAGDRETCLAAGMDDYLSKPFSVDHFICMVQTWLDNVEVANYTRG